MKSLTVLALLLAATHLHGQNREEAEKLVAEGIELHDKGEYDKAIRLYDRALELDTNNLFGLGEKALTLLTTGKYAEAIVYAQRAIDHHPGEEALGSVFVTCGNALDAQGRTNAALSKYEEGLEMFPDFYMLHFNKGITLSGMDERDSAIACFQRSVRLKPTHAGSHSALARSLTRSRERIPSILAYCTFLIIESRGTRAEQNLELMEARLSEGVQKTGKKKVTIGVDVAMLGDTLPDGRPAENSFKDADLVRVMQIALQYDKLFIKLSDVQKFKMTIESICRSLAETREKNYGFYWYYYAPFFIDMNAQGHTETFANIAYSSRDADASKWLQSHRTEVTSFYEWSKGFDWY